MLRFDINTLNEEELSLLLYIINVHSPLALPKMEFSKETAKWFIHEKLIMKVKEAFPSLTEEGQNICNSMLDKMGSKPLPLTNITGSSSIPVSNT